MSFWDCLTGSEQYSCIEVTAAREIGRSKGYHPCGIVRHKWDREIYPAIKDILRDQGNKKAIYGSSSKRPGCSCRLFMLDTGSTWKTPRPTVVVFCHDKQFAKKTVDLLQKMNMLKKSVLGFDFLPSVEEITLAADHSEAAPPVAQEMNPSLCGSRICISPSQVNLFWTRATTGGVIVINGRYYGLTAAHAFFRAEEDAKTDSDADSPNESAGTISNGDGQNQDDNSIHHGAQNLSQTNENRREAETAQMETRSIYLDDQMSSSQRSSLDIDRTLQKPPSARAENLLSTIETRANPYEQPSSQLNMENDWALFEISSTLYHRPNTVYAPTGEILQAVNVAQREPSGPVLVAAGVSGVLETACLGPLSGIILPHSTTMLDAWVVTQSCRHGDCGAWVLDRQTGDVFGMIVATSYDSQESYCLPISTIFDSILTSRPKGTTISFPGAVNQAYCIPPPPQSHPSSTDYLDSEEFSGPPDTAQDLSGSNLEATLSEIQGHELASGPTAISEQLTSDAMDHSTSKLPEESYVLQARKEATRVKELEPTTEIDVEHSQPAQSRWARVKNQEFPSAALERLGVPWRQAEGKQNHIVIDRELAVALRKARAQQQSGNMEGSPLDMDGTSTGDLNMKAQRAYAELPNKSLPSLENKPTLLTSWPTGTKPPLDLNIRRKRTAIPEPELAAMPGAPLRADDANSDKSDNNGKTTKRHFLGGEEVQVTRRSFRSETKLPAKLVEDRTLHALGYSFYEQDGIYYILEALEKEDIDQVVELSKQYRFDQGGPVNRQSTNRVFEHSFDPTQNPVQLAVAKYDLQFEEEIRKLLSETKSIPNRYARTLTAASRELIQKFRENRSQLGEALVFLEDHERGGAVPETNRRPGQSEYLDNARPRAEYIPPRRFPHPETVVSRTVHDRPIGREEIVMRRESPHRPSPRQTYTGVTDHGDRNSLPRRERSVERVDLRSTSERNGRAYHEDILIDHDKKTGSEAQPEALKTATGKVTAPGQEGFRRDIQEEAEFYNKRIEERSIVGEATNGAIRDWAIIDIPPGTKKVAMDGVGGGRLEVTWQLYSGVRRSKFYQDGIANEETVQSGESTRSAEGTLRFDRVGEATELELERELVKRRIKERQKEQGKEREKDRAKVIEGEKAVHFEKPGQISTNTSNERPLMDTYKRVSKKYVSPEALDHHRLDWLWDRDDNDFILIKGNVSDDLQRRLFKYTRDSKEQKLIKNQAEFQYDDLENIFKDARAIRLDPERSQLHQPEREREAENFGYAPRPRKRPSSPELEPIVRNKEITDGIERRSHAAPPRETETDVTIKEREDVRYRDGPEILREDDRRTSTGALVLRKREIEDFEYAPKPRRRSPSPEPVPNVSREEIIIRRSSPSPERPPPWRREVDRDEVIIRRDDRSSDRREIPPREVEWDREEVTSRKDDRERRGSRYDNINREEVIIHRDDDHSDRIPPPPRTDDEEEIIIRRDKREEDRASRISTCGRDNYTLPRPISHERKRSRGGRASSDDDEEIIIRREERKGRGRDCDREEIITRKGSRSPSRAPSVRPAPPQEPAPIYAPPIHREIIYHERHIDHGYETALTKIPSRAPSPASVVRPAPPEERVPSPASVVRPAPPKEQALIYAPPIHREIIYHERYIDHGHETALARIPSRTPSPPMPPPPGRERSEERIEIHRIDEYGKADDKDVIIDLATGEDASIQADRQQDGDSSQARQTR